MNDKIDLVSLPKKSFWKLSLPIIAFCLFDAIYGIIDMLWISRISDDAFFAMSMSIPFVIFIFSIGDSLGQGTNSIMSRFIGSGDYESAYNSLIHGMILCNIIWFIIALCFLFANGVLFYVDDQKSYVLIFDYLVPLIVFSFIFIFNNLFSETMQAEGNSRTPTILIISSNILNLILDPIFIFNLNLGIKGAAYATVLSASLVFVPILYMYCRGRTKIPLSMKYFKFRPYIIFEIFKVALPNFLDSALWLLSASYINSVLLVGMNSMGPILYSASVKLKNLLIVPVRGYGRALMSVTGHLFGARKFDDLKAMFKYVLKISFFTTAILMIVFFFTRDYMFDLFSITGMQTQIFWISLAGIFIMIPLPFSMISAKMLDGFGKSLYSLMFTAAKVFFEIGLIFALIEIFNDISSVLIAIIFTEIISAIVYYFFLIYLFKNFNKEYDGKATVKTFMDEDECKGMKSFEETDKNRYISFLKRGSMHIALVAMVIAVLLISYETVTLHGNLTLITGIISILVVGILSYFLDKFDRIKFQIIEIFIISLVLVLLMEGADYLTAVLFIVIGVMLQYIIAIYNRLAKKD